MLIRVGVRVQCPSGSHVNVAMPRSYVVTSAGRDSPAATSR